MGLERLNEIKKAKGLTNEQLAEMSGVPKTTIDKITAGTNTNPKLGTLQSLCRALECRLDDLDDPAPETKKSPAPAEASTGDKIDPRKLQDMLIETGMVKPGEDLTDADLHFLISVVDIIQAWFNK